MFDKLRAKMCNWCIQDARFSGIIEVDAFYFESRRIPSNRARGASRKTIVFGIFKREGKVYTKMVPNASKKTLLSIIRGKVALESAMAGMATMVWWTWDMTNTTECIISHDESTCGFPSMGWNPFRVMLSGAASSF